MTWNTSQLRRYWFTVRVNGVVRAHDPAGITWGQDITSDLPSAVTAGGQVAHRTGSIVWANTGVTTAPGNPWRPGATWQPVVGDPVTIDATDGVNTHRVFTGVIDTVEGDAFGHRSSKIVAYIKGANKNIRRGALTQVGQPVAGGGPRMLSTTPVWVVSEVAREMGYSSVPTPLPYTRMILDAPLQGSTYIYSDAANFNAVLVTSHRSFGETVPVLWRSARDGFGVGDSVLEWVPGNGGGTGAGSVGVSLLVYSVHQDDALITVTHGSTGTTFVRVRGDGTVRATTRINGVDTYQELGQLGAAGDAPRRVSVIFRGGAVSARLDGVTASGSAPTPSGAVTRIRLDAGAAACVAGVQIWHAQSITDHWAATWAPTAHYRYGTGTAATAVAPSVRDEKARDVLESYADALLCPVWVDQYGHLQIVTGKALHDQSPSLTVDALSEVSDLAYSMALLDHRPGVELTYAHAHHTSFTTTTARTTVWQGRGGEITPDSPDETFVEVPEDEEWIGMSSIFSANRLTFDNREAFNAGNGSWWGLSEDITAPDYLTLTDTGTRQVENLTPWAWKITTTYPGVNGAMQKAPTSTYIKTRYREMDLPIYRARALVRYEDRTVAATSNAPGPGEILTHDAGKWITTTVAANDLAAWILSMVGTPTPVLESLRVRFDPRLEVGTKIKVKAQRVFGVDFVALVLSTDHDPGSDSTTITARVTQVLTFAETFDDVEHAHLGQSLAEWEDARTGRTLDAVAADPYTTY